MVRFSMFFRLLLVVGFSFFLTACGNKGKNNAEGPACNTRADCESGQRCNAEGVCTAASATCQFASECGIDEYCAEGACTLAACADDAECATGAICASGTCRTGCRDNDDCGDGQACSAAFICDVAGCSTDSCPAFQSCDQGQAPPACLYTGDCANDAHCAGYAQQVDDGNEYLCSEAEQRCVVKPPCGEDSDCRGGDICEPRSTDGRKVCRRGCRSNDGCRSGYICDLNDLLCASGCDSVDDCPNDGNTYACADLVCVKTCETRNECLTGQVCSGSPRRCQACRDDNECPATEFCDRTLGITEADQTDPVRGLCALLPPSCPADGFGDNHNQNNPFVIPAVPFMTTAAMQPLFCRENQGGEWFSVVAAAGDVIEVQLDYRNQAGNLDVALRRAQGDEIVAAQAPPTVDGGREILRFGVDLGGTFLIHVRGTLVSANSPYDLSVKVAPPPACTADALEPNGMGMPAPLPAAIDHTNLEVCGNDIDLYTLAVSDNQVVTIVAEAPIALGNIDLFLRNPAGVQVAAAITRMSKETIEFAVETGGNYQLEVRVTSGVGNVKYDLDWRQRDNNCADTFEVNDTCPASAIAEGTYTGLNVCADTDWYAIDLLPLQTVTITATYDRAVSAGDLDVTLIGPSDCATLAAGGQETTIGMTTQVQEVVQYQAMSGGTYNIQVFLFSGIQAEYTLDIDISDGPPCVDDSYEPNDNAANAVLVDRTGASTGADNVITGLKTCDMDQDWYRIDLLVGDTIRFDVQFDNARGDLDAELIGPGNVTVALSETSTNNESVTYTVGAGEAGSYYLKVNAKFAARNDYWVLTYLNGTGPVDPICPDELENNDDRASAALITPGTYGLLVCGSPKDNDWYRMPLTAGQRLNIDVQFQHINGNIDVFLFDDSGAVQTVAEARSTTDNETISFVTNRDQVVVWRVEAITNQAALPYTMVVSTTAAGVCSDDPYAGNDGSASAATVTSPGLYPRLRLCDGTQDWFKFNLTAGRLSEVFINFDGAKADLDLTVYSPALGVLGSGTTTTSDESFEFTPATTGTYYAQITGKANARLDYDLLLYTDTDGDGTKEGPADRACPDIFEQNDSPTSPAQIPAGTYSNLLLCSPSDLDYYRVFVPAGATITASINFSNAEGDLDMRLLNPANQQIDESRTMADTESVSATNSGLGANYTVAVVSAGGTFSSYYQLDVDLAFADACMDDATTRGTKAAATSTATGAYKLTLCEGSEDWLSLGSVTAVDARIEFKNQLGDLDIELHNTAGLVATSAGTLNTEELAMTGLTGAHWLRILPKGNAFIRNNYDLWLSLNGASPSVPYCPDAFERNDDVASMSTVTLPNVVQIPALIACGTEEDWYLTGNLTTTTYQLAMFYNHGAGSDLEVAVWPSTADPLVDPPMLNINTAANDAIGNLVVTTAGAHIIRVRNTAAAGVLTRYELLLGRPTMYSTACPEDSSEPNDGAFTPAGISFPSFSAFGLCGQMPLDNDFFRFTVPTAGSVTATALFDAASMDAALRVEDEMTGMVMGQSNTNTGNRETVTFTAVAGRNYIVSVQHVSGDGPYFLRVQ